MKVLVITALFAFVAVQVCQSAPVEEVVKLEDKVENVDNKDNAAEAVPAVPVDVASPADPVEIKPELSSVDGSAKPAETPVSAPADEKKE